MLDTVNAGHIDQAAGLRRLFSTRTGRAIAFVSGREACGRTRLLVQTAAALAQAGESVLVIDENAGGNTVHSAFGLHPKGDLLDLASHSGGVQRLIQPAIRGLGVVSAARLAQRGDALEPESISRVDAGLRSLQESHSYLLIDCADRSAGGISPLAQASPSVAVVVAAQSTAITRAYAMIKRLSMESGRLDFQVVITRARSDEESLAIFRNLQRTAREHLGVSLEFLAGARQPATEHIADSIEMRLKPGPAGFRSLRPTSRSRPSAAR